jgi:hypothetical protein
MLQMGCICEEALQKCSSLPLLTLPSKLLPDLAGFMQA